MREIIVKSKERGKYMAMVHGKNAEIHNSSVTISLFIISVKVKSLLIEIPKTLFLVANISDLITLQVNCFAIDKMIYI